MRIRAYCRGTANCELSQQRTVENKQSRSSQLSPALWGGLGSSTADALSHAGYYNSKYLLAEKYTNKHRPTTRKLRAINPKTRQLQRTMIRAPTLVSVLFTSKYHPHYTSPSKGV